MFKVGLKVPVDVLIVVLISMVFDGEIVETDDLWVAMTVVVPSVIVIRSVSF